MFTLTCRRLILFLYNLIIYLFTLHTESPNKWSVSIDPLDANLQMPPLCVSLAILQFIQHEILNSGIFSLPAFFFLPLHRQNVSSSP